LYQSGEGFSGLIFYLDKGDKDLQNNGLDKTKDNKDKSQDMRDYSEDKVYDRKHAQIFALLRWLECEFFGLFVFLSLMATTLLLGNAGNFIFGTFGLICYVCVMVDFGIKEGSKAGIKHRVRGDNTSRNFGLKLGAIAGIPSLLAYIMLLLSYFGVIGSAVLPFKILNSGLWGYINLFVHDMNIANMSPILLGLYPLIILMYPIVTFRSFRLGYDNIDLQTKIMYKN
jgi:hypothetical protein